MKIQNPFRFGLVATLGVGLGLLIITSIISLQTILIYIGAALFIALGLEPIVGWLEKKHLPRWSAVLIVVLGVVVLVAGLVWMLVPIIAEQITKLVKLVPTIQQQIGDLSLVEYIKAQFPWVPVDSIIGEVGKFFSDINSVANLTGGLLAFVVGVGSALFLILTLYFTASLPSMKRGMYQLVPASKRANFADLSEQITSSVGRYVIGQASTAAINGVLSFIFLSIIQAPFPAVLAVVAFSFSLIPLVGTLTGSIIITLTCLIPGLGGVSTAIIAAIYYLVYMQIEAYVLSPRIMSRAVAVPGAVVVIAALAGGSLLGLLGALIAIPTAASILLIIKQVLIPRQNEL
jgi:predicted PurR-regulated permease PerM